MTEFDKKIIDNFPGKIVRKDLTALMKKGANVPTYNRPLQVLLRKVYQRNCK